MWEGFPSGTESRVNRLPHSSLFVLTSKSVGKDTFSDEHTFPVLAPRQILGRFEPTSQSLVLCVVVSVRGWWVTPDAVGRGRPGASLTRIPESRA